MCYTGSCCWESYPRGYNEGCVCKLPRGYECPMTIDDEEELERLNEEFEDEPDEDLIRGNR